MSKAFPPPLPSQTASVSFLQQPNNLASTFASTSTLQSDNVSTTLTLGPQAATAEALRRKSGKVKKRSPEEREIASRAAARISSRLAADHHAVLYPDTETPFSDVQDAVNRLLPYHVFQQPKDDLGKGKGKATEDIEETKFALECFRRRKALEDRFRKVRTREGKRSAPSDQDYVLAQIVLESERGETAALNAEFRAARTELDRIRDKRLSVPSYRTQSYYSATPQPYYRNYQYSYAQPYTPSSTTTPTTSTSGAIPVQLPVASLPALHALGIVPVAPATAAGQPQGAHPAILRGSSADGSMLNLEINVSLLQNSQMNGLAMVLNTLLTRPSSSSGTTPAKKE